jgi:DNA polymerase-1
VVAHNAKFELGWLKRCGLDLRSVRCYDTMLGEWVLLGNERQSGLSLQASCERRGIEGKEDYVAKLIKLGVSTENIPRDWLEEYCHEDVRATEQLFNVQVKLLKERGQLHLQVQRSAVCAALADIEFNGLYLDKKRVEEEYHKALSEYVETKTKLEDYGSINWRSRKQVGELLYDELGFKEPTDRRGNPRRTPTGGRATDKAAISSLVATNAKQREFVRLFKSVANLNAKLTKSLEFFKGVVDLYDSRFYGIFNQGTTSTHRLSSSGRPILLPESELSEEEGLPGVSKPRGIQLQNIPREFKGLFCASDPDYVLVDCDASQLEFRAAADLGNDELAKQEIRDGVDVHTNTARVFLDAGTQPEFRGLTLAEARQPAKPQTFKPLYGGRGNTPAEKAYCKFFQDKYKGIYAAQTAWAHEVLRSGELKTAYGMIFRWPRTAMSRSGYIDNTTSIFNFPVQGFATAELIPIIVVLVWQGIKHLRARMICTIHDSVILEVHKDDVTAVKDILIRAFTVDIYNVMERLYGYKIRTQLGCEIKVGYYWGEGKGQKYEAKDY